MYDISWVKNTIRGLFMNVRHYKLLFMITMQYALGIPPALRSNVDYVFILGKILILLEKGYMNIMLMFPTYEIFSQVMDQCTSNYECLVIDNTTKSNKIEDIVFWYKANDHPAFKLGAPEFWQHHSRNYNNSINDEDTDINQYGKKKNTPQINVKKY